MFRFRHVWLAVALAAGLFVAPSVRGADTKLLPNHTEWMFSINLKQIFDSPLVKANKENVDQLLALAKNALPPDEGAEKFLKAAGFDLLKDTVSLSVSGPAGTDPDKLVIMVEGRFQKAKFLDAADQFAKAAGDVVKVGKIGDTKVFEISVPGEKVIHAALVNEKTLVATASKDILADVIARDSGTKKSALKKEIQGLLDTVSGKQSLNFVATGAAIAQGIKNAPNIPNPDAVAAALGQIDGLSGAITLTKEVQFQLAVNTKDADTAQKMAQGAQLALGAVKAMVQEKAKTDEKAAIAADVLKTLRVTNMGPNILFRGEITLDALEKIFKNLPM
ncbi:MAG: hypothetical protein U0793_16305 [Gemmataceae bacterium]